MDNLVVPPPVRTKLGDAGCDGLVSMFAEAHRCATESFERNLDQNAALLTERVDRRLADLRADLLKWSFLFWLGQVATIAAVLGLILPRR